MELVIDANIIVGIYKECVLAIETDLSGSCRTLLRRVGMVDIAHVDEGGHIVSEWRRTINNEWFEIWYTDLVRDGGLRMVKTETYAEVRRELKRLGFPNSRDFWHVRVACSVARSAGGCSLVTEDADHHDPTWKALKGRARIGRLVAGRGKVLLKLRTYNVSVVCMEGYNVAVAGK